MKRKKFSLKSEYKSSWDYIVKSKKFIYAIIGIFLFSFFIGFFIPTPELLVNAILDFITELLEKTSGMSHFALIKFIFFNNIQSSFFAMAFGVILGIFPIIAAVSNGYLLGFVSSITVLEGGVFVLWRLLPHGIFELPAIFISLGLGLRLGTFIFYEKKMETFRNFLFNSIKVFFYIVLPLLIIAGIIEGTLIAFS